MDRIIALIRLGVKYLYLYRRRYAFLLAALVFSFAIITLISSAKDGMYNNVYYSAQSHYAGDVVAVGYNTAFHTQRHLSEHEVSSILHAAGVSGISPQHTVKRTIYNGDGIVFYNGIAIRLTNLLGSDWDSEMHIFSNMSFREPSSFSFNDDSIILSTQIAGRLGARIGDLVTVEVNTRWYQKNTGLFVVDAIVDDTSIFGYYKAYISRASLNRLLLYNEGDSSSVGFFFENTGAAEKNRRLLHEALSRNLDTGPLVYDREQRSAATGGWEGSKVFLFTLPVYLSEISELLGAMNIISYCLYAMMLVIILFSVAVTYRLILHERSREMGVMGAMGFSGRDVRLVLWTEMIVLGLISLLLGFLLAWVFGWGISFLSFSWFPSFEIFMKNGRLTVLYLPGTMLLNGASIFILLFMATFVLSFRASRRDLPGLLSGELL